VLATIADTGYIVGLGRAGDRYVVTATERNGERFVVRASTVYHPFVSGWVLLLHEG
jgi:hypothetical protein